MAADESVTSRRGNYERSLFVSSPPSRVWKAFTELDDLRIWHGTAELFEPRAGGRVRFSDPGYPPVEGVVQEATPERLLRWEVLADRSTIEERFEMAPGGTAITLLHTRPGGWPRPELEAIALGWEESLADLILLLERGIPISRHLAFRSWLGATFRNAPGGVEVVDVRPQTFASEVGLQAGDLLIQLGKAPIFDRSDIALITREHEPGEEMEAVFIRDHELIRQTAALSERGRSD